MHVTGRSFSGHCEQSKTAVKIPPEKPLGEGAPLEINDNRFLVLLQSCSQLVPLAEHQKKNAGLQNQIAQDTPKTERGTKTENSLFPSHQPGDTDVMERKSPAVSVVLITEFKQVKKTMGMVKNNCGEME